MDRFEDKVVLVTGAASGIGQASALRMAAEGARVACADIQQTAVEDTVKQIREKGGEAVPIACDVSDPAGLVDEVRPRQEVEQRAAERLAEFADKDGRSLAVTKRHLRRDTAARIAAQDEVYLDEFLDCWFAPETRARIEQIAASLKGNR